MTEAARSSHFTSSMFEAISHKMTTTQRKLDVVEKGARIVPNHIGTVFFLHGSGDSGEGLNLWMKELLGREFAFDYLKIVLPSAPIQPYTPNLGRMSNVWFDRERISPTACEILPTINDGCQALDQLVQEEVKAGTPISSIVVGGFSMGGALALHYAFRYQPGLRGVFAMSSFLNDESAVYKSTAKFETRRGEGRRGEAQRWPTLFYSHGMNDPLVQYEWGRATYEKLLQRGVEGTFLPVPEMFHEMRGLQVLELMEWIQGLYKDVPLPTLERTSDL